jgi:hypothetical protein
VRSRRWPHITRDTVLFVVGMAGIIHEMALTNVDRPYLLVLFGAMVGLPVFIRSTDEKKPR